jgi:uncharacterized protein (TIGR03437 family)
MTLRTGRSGPVYQEAASAWHHSPILGWAPDGYPIDGPYGYSAATDATSPINRIKSSFQLRTIATRTTLPTWSLPNHTSVAQNLTPSQYGPDVSLQFPLGRYNEDFDFITGQGDLDQYNGRVTVTPEFPNGTYAYYVTIDDTGAPAFPYIYAGQFRGVASGNFPNTVPTGITDYFNNGILASGPTNPAITSWSTKYSSQNATVISGFDPSAGPTTTWKGWSTPALAEAQRIRYSSASVYVTANGLAAYPMGPWFSSDMTSGVFVNFPTGNPSTFQMPLTPAPASTLTNTGGGPQGLWVNGVYIFNFIDGASYINATGLDSAAGNLPSYLAAITSAASFEQGPVAPGSLVIAWPLYFTSLPNTVLGLGITVTVTDSSGSSTLAQVSYSSAGQMNFQMPKALAIGAASVTITSAAGAINSKINIQPTYPNLFMLNVNALAAAYVARVHKGQQTFEQVDNPIALNGDQVYLSVYGSGLGAATSATATIGGVNATVTYSGTQSNGADQYNILIPASLAGQGKVDLIVTAAGKPSNPVNVTIQ